MNRSIAKTVLGNLIQPDGSLRDQARGIDWSPEVSTIALNGVFKAQELEAISYWMGQPRRGIGVVATPNTCGTCWHCLSDGNGGHKCAFFSWYYGFQREECSVGPGCTCNLWVDRDGNSPGRGMSEPPARIIRTK